MRAGIEDETESSCASASGTRPATLRTAQSVELERATWQHDIGVTAEHVVFIESPTTRLPGATGGAAVPFGWVPGAEGWVGVVERGGDGTDVRWLQLDPCLVTHVLGADERADGRSRERRRRWRRGGGIVLYVCCYAAPERGQPVDLTSSVVGPAGIGLTPIGGQPGACWSAGASSGDRVERSSVDERYVEYPTDGRPCEGAAVPVRLLRRDG